MSEHFGPPETCPCPVCALERMVADGFSRGDALRLLAGAFADHVAKRLPPFDLDDVQEFINGKSVNATGGVA